MKRFIDPRGEFSFHFFTLHLCVRELGHTQSSRLSPEDMFSGRMLADTAARSRVLWWCRGVHTHINTSHQHLITAAAHKLLCEIWDEALRYNKKSVLVGWAGLCHLYSYVLILNQPGRVYNLHHGFPPQGFFNLGKQFQDNVAPEWFHTWGSANETKSLLHWLINSCFWVCG